MRDVSVFRLTNLAVIVFLTEFLNLSRPTDWNRVKLINLFSDSCNCRLLLFCESRLVYNLKSLENVQIVAVRESLILRRTNGHITGVLINVF